MARDVPEPEFIAAAQRLLKEVQAATADVAAERQNIARQGGGQRGAVGGQGGTTPRERVVAEDRVEAATQRGLNAELRRLETVKAETNELKRQSLIIAEQANYSRGRATAGQQLGRELLVGGGIQGQEAARIRNVVQQLQRGPLVTGLRSPIALGAAPYGARAAGPAVALQEEAAIVRQVVSAETARLGAVREGTQAIRLNAALTRQTAASERRVREANIAEAQQADELIAVRARQIANLAKLSAGPRQEALGYLFPGAPGPNQAALNAARRTAGGSLGGAVSFSQPRGASPQSIFESGLLGRQYPANIQRATQDIQRLGLVQAEASQQMRRHGALTTEFLQSLARGETTLSEFRFQIGSTIAKFGGWTLAAASVFTALSAIEKLGAGAKESANGVATLQRFFDQPGAFNADKAREGFRNVSRDVNVPIKDVVETQSQFARVFHNQADSLTATRTALLATKLDNIALGDSYRFLTAIVQEGQVPIARIPVLFDQISAAQRRLGARASETLPALARSLAAVQNAAGSTDKNTVLNQLLAIASTTQVATGQTGSSVGTALYRGASTFFPRPDNQAILKGFGIDTSKGFTDSIIQAVRKAQTLGGEQRRQISQAFLGPQLGGRFASLFNRQDQLQQALTDTSPLKSQGSAAEELSRQLQRVDEQLARFGNTLERIGANLGESGVFAPLGLALHTVNALTGTVERLFDAFNHVPQPVRQILVGLLEVYGVMKLLRTGFGTAAAEAAHVGFLGAPQATRDRRQTVIGLRGTETTQANLYEQTSNRAALAREESRIALQAGEQARLEAQALEAQGLTNQTKARHSELIAQHIRLTQEGETLERQALASEERTAVLQGQVNATRARITALQRGEALTLEEQQAAQAFNARAAGVGAAGAGAASAAAGAAAGAAASRGAATAATTALTAEAAMGAEMAADGAKIGAAASRTSAITGGLSALGGRLLGLGFGGLVGGIITGFTVYEVLAQQDRAAKEKLNAEFDKLRTSVHTRGALNSRVEQAGRFFQDNFPNVTSDQYETIQRLAAARTRAASDRDYGIPQDKLRARLDAAALRFQGHPRQFEAYYEKIQAAAHNSLEVVTGDQASLSKLLDQLATTAARFFSLQSPTGADPFAQFRQGTLAQNTQNLDQVAQRYQIGQRPRRIIPTLARGFVFDTSRFGRSNNPDVLKGLADEQQQITDFVQSQVSQITQGVSSLPVSRQRAVYQRALDVIKRADKELGTAFKDRKDQLNDARRKLAVLESAAAASGGDQLRGGQRLSRTPFDAQIAILRVQIRNFEQNVAITRRAVAQAQRALRALLREQQQAEAQARQEAAEQANADARTLLEAQNRYSTSQVGSESGRAQSTIAGLKRILAFDRAHGGDRSSILDDLSAINEAYTQIRESAKQSADDARRKAEELYRAQLAARLAATGDPIKRDRIQLEGDVHLLRGQPRGTADYFNQLANVRNDRRQLTQDIAQEDISQADFEHTIGKLTDQQYIRELRGILRTKHLSRDLRRQLRTQIYQLTHQDAEDGNLDLNVGNIRLPTLYDVRRLGKQGTNTAPVTLQQTNHYTIPVRNDADAERVGSVLQDIHGANVKGAMRAAGIG